MEFFEENTDFENFLDEEYSSEKESVSQEEVIDDIKVNYYIGKIKKNQEMKKMITDRSKAILEEYKDKVNLWKEKKHRALDNNNEFLMDQLKKYYDANAKNNKTKLHFPEGNLGYYKSRTSIAFDDEMIMEYIKMIRKKNNDPTAYSDFIKEVQTIDTKELKNQGVIDLETNTLKINDVAFPGVRITPGKEEFNIR